MSSGKMQGDFLTHIAMPNTPEKVLDHTQEGTPNNFEAAMRELDALVEKMEAGQLPLEESLAAYQRGTVLLKYCETILANAEQRIQILSPQAGNPTNQKLQDFSEE